MSKVGDKLGIDYELTVKNIYFEDNGMRLLKCINSKEKNRTEAVIEFDIEYFDIEYLMEESVNIRNIKQDGIPKIYNVFSDKESTYISTEFIEGSTLEEYFNEYAIEYEDKLKLIEIIGTAISYIHRYQGETLVDKIAPNNILVTEEGLVYLLEYGFTKYMKRDISYGISTNVYLAPELTENYEITRVMDFRSDIYAFGGLIYYILTEKKPNKKTILADELKPYIEKIVLKCLSEDMDDRYDTIDQVLRDMKKNS